MRITDFLKAENCVASIASSEKEQALRELAGAVDRLGLDQETVLAALMERERLCSTGIGGEVAIPHAKIKGLPSLAAAFGRSERGVDFSSMDNKPVKWIFLLLASDGASAVHLKALARISRLMKSKELRERMDAARTGEELFKILKEEDEKLG